MKDKNLIDLGLGNDFACDLDFNLNLPNPTPQK